ncbi:hypothetical protein F9K77_16570 [Ochrobactrum sp. LMG 5442]|nr:hypothetical protein F9K77_16570 [Ochrobactrum sp. LMG 5442]
MLIGELARHRRSKLSVTLANREKGRAGQKAFIWKIISRQGEYCPVSTKENGIRPDKEKGGRNRLSRNIETILNVTAERIA